jgi:hypothetical protein
VRSFTGERNHHAHSARNSGLLCRALLRSGRLRGRGRSRNRRRIGRPIRWLEFHLRQLTRRSDGVDSHLTATESSKIRVRSQQLAMVDGRG